MSHVCVMSLWRNDADRNLEARVAHLAAKALYTEHTLSYLWLVGDTTDTTARDLIEYGMRHIPESVQISKDESGVEPGGDILTRRRRFSANANAMFAKIPDAADYVLLHESDIQSPPDLVDQLLAGPPLPCAAWPVLELNGRDQFYDIWAFKHRDGTAFPPESRPPAKPLRVSSFGTVWMAPADLVRNRVISELCVVDLCRQWVSEGIDLWCDPRIIVRQPAALWTPS